MRGLFFIIGLLLAVNMFMGGFAFSHEYGMKERRDEGGFITDSTMEESKRGEGQEKERRDGRGEK